MADQSCRKALAAFEICTAESVDVGAFAPTYGLENLNRQAPNRRSPGVGIFPNTGSLCPHYDVITAVVEEIH